MKQPEPFHKAARSTLDGLQRVRLTDYEVWQHRHDRFFIWFDRMLAIIWLGIVLVLVQAVLGLGR